ncbi:hypothetical protein Tco_1177004 [Tanacetum coccineum]
MYIDRKAQINSINFSYALPYSFLNVLDVKFSTMSKHKEIYDIPSHSKKVFANMKRRGNKFSGRITPLFPTMLVQAQEEVAEGSANPIDTPHTSTHSQPSTSQHATDEEVTPHSHDPLLSGEDSLKLIELMDLCTKLTNRVLALETTKTTQALERVQSSDDESLGAQEDASKQGMSKDIDIILNDATQEDDNLMLDIAVLDKEEVVTTIEKEVSTANPVTTAGEVVTAVAPSTTTITATITPKDITLAQEITLAQALATMKSLKPKVKDVDSVIVVVPTTPTTAKAKGIVMQESDGTTAKTTTIVPSQKPKDKGKAIMVEPEVPLKKKDQVRLDEEYARQLEAEEQAELERIQKERATQEEASRAAIYEEMDNIQAMLEADELLAARVQAEEQEL